MTNYTSPLNAEWSDTIQITDTSTPNNGDLIARAPKQLLDNLNWLKKTINEDLTAAVQTLNEEIKALDPDGDVLERLSLCEQNILALALAMAIEVGAAVDGTSDNIVVEVFEDTSGYIIASGVYDAVNHRIYA